MRTLTVFAAASLTEAFTEMAAAFEASNPGVEVNLNFSSSQLITRQIEAGARPDVFASADREQLQTLVAVGLISPGAPRLFLQNRLTVLLPASNPAGVLDLEDLSRPGLKLVLASDHVPVGHYTREALARMNNAYGADFSRGVLANVVSYEDNVKQVVAKVRLGEADAGIAYASDAVAARELMTIEIPAEYNVTAEYAIAALVEAPESALAAEFIEYVLSPAGQASLEKWGFDAVR